MIKNQTTKEIVSHKEIICKNIWQKARGLMFRIKKQNLIMFFKQEEIVPLHNFFVFYPIDVILLDSNKKVVEIKENFKPFTFYTPKHKCKYLIELGQKQAKNKLKLGDSLSII